MSWTAIKIVCCSIALAALAGCAGNQAYRAGTALMAQGKTEQGLVKIAEAVQLEPGNVQYRLALATGRASVVQGRMREAETARRQGRLGDAEKALREVQITEPENQMAEQGLAAVALARRHQLVMQEAEALLKKGTPADLAAGLELLRVALLEDPKNKAGLNLRARFREAAAKASRPELKLATAYRQPISLEFRDAPLKAVLEVVAKVSGLNFYYDKDIRPDLRVTVFARNTSTEEAIRLLLVTNQLEQKVLNDNSLLIYPGTPQKLKDYQALAVRSFYLTNADVKAVANTLKTIVKTRDIVLDERLGIIFMRDTPEAIRMAERIVALQDLGDSEVVLDVEIMEVKRSRLLELGVHWPSQLTLSPLTNGAQPLSLNDLRNLSSSTIQGVLGSATINANQTGQSGNTLANPRIRVRNKDKAKIQIGDRVPIITTTSTSTGFISESVSYVDVGLKLEVEPTIYLDDDVAIKVNLEVSNLVREIVSRTGTLAYQIGNRSANTTLRLQDGETQILAGLISDEDRTSANQVPLVGSLPVAGRLFGSQKDENERTEIMLSITPHVVRSNARPDMLDAEFDSGTESNIGAAPLRLSEPVANPVPAGAARGTAAKTPATAGAPAATPAPPSASGPTLSWQGPAEARVGEQFTLALNVASQQALSGMPLLLGFDTQQLQVMSVQEGDFFRQGHVATQFTQRVDPAQGKVFVALVRQGTSGAQGGVNGKGSLMTVTFKALKPGTPQVQLLSASPEPDTGTAPALPPAHPLKVVP